MHRIYFYRTVYPRSLIWGYTVRNCNKGLFLKPRSHCRSDQLDRPDRQKSPTKLDQLIDEARTRLLHDRYSIVHDPTTTIPDYFPTSTRQPIRSLLDQPDPYTIPTRSKLDQLDLYSISIRSRPDQIELVVLGP